jgi:hypothetical protein
MAVRDDFTAGEVLAAADLNDTFASKPPFAYGTATPSTTVEGFIWYDENDTPPAPKFWDGSAFETFGGALTSSTDSVLTLQTTTSTSYTDLATAGPAVTVTTGTKALVMINAQIYGGAGQLQYMSFAISGATTVAATDNFSMANEGALTLSAGVTFLVTGLTAGSNTFTAKYRVTGGSGVYELRRITVVDMGS